MKENKRYKRLETAKWISIRKLVPGLLLTVRSAGSLSCSKRQGLLTVATLKRFFTRNSCRLGTAMMVTRAGVSFISGNQYEIILSPGDHAKSLKINTTLNDCKMMGSSTT